MIIDYRRIGEREHSVNLSNTGVVVRRYTLRFRVITDNPTDSEGFIRQDIRTPRVGQIFQDVDGFVDLVARCKKVDVNETSEDMRVHEVVAEYDTESIQAERPENPLEWETEVDVDWDQTEFAIDRDVVTGEFILNSAGDAPDPAQTTEIALGRITITRNEPLVTSYGLLYNWLNKTNSDVWLGAQPYTMKITSIKPTKKQSQHVPGGYYSSVAYSFLWNPMLDWRIRFLDQGYREIVAGERRIIHDETGAPVGHQQLLNGAGVKLAFGGQPVWRGAYHRYVAVPFQPLGF